jgi:hypothetical protein
LLTAALLCPAPARAENVSAATLTDEVVGESIKRGVEYLLNSRNKEGTWETGRDYVAAVPTAGAFTCLCVYALLHIGESSSDVRLKPTSKELAAAMKFVVDLKADSTYVASLQASALALMPRDAAVRDAMVRCRNYLVNSTLARGGHYYSLARAKKEPGIYDSSNSNFALLGLAALDETDLPGLACPPGYWQTYDSFWRRTQNKDAGWGYRPGERPESYPRMTAAGVASLLLCREFLTTDLSAVPKADKPLESGLAVMEKEYDPASSDLYYLYTLERIGLVGGFKYFRSLNWYKEGAAVLINQQAPDGWWNNDLYATEPHPDVFTAYGLLFLARGRSPVFMNKLQYEGPWDARTRDDANVTNWVAKSFEKPLAWQSVQLKADQDWLDAPVLLITGSKDPKFSSADVDLLKAYVRAGGIIFSTADNASLEFSKAMRKYALQVSDGQYEMHELEPANPIFNLWAKLDHPPRLEGMSNGVRTLWIHSPADLGGLWQRNKPREFKTAYELAGNLYYYVCGKSALGHRLDTLAVKKGEEAAVRTVPLARVKYGGNWDPEPGAWPRMARLAQARFHTILQVEEVDAAQLDAAHWPIAHLTGTAAVHLSDEARAAIVKYVDAGGTLVIDACGGNQPFVESMKGTLGELFKDQPLEAVPSDSPLFAGGSPDTVKIEEVEWRKFTRIRDGRVADEHPRLMGIKKGERWGVIFSGDDLTSGLLGTNTWGVAGYMPASAQQIVQNILVTTKK